MYRFATATVAMVTGMPTRIQPRKLMGKPWRSRTEWQQQQQAAAGGSIAGSTEGSARASERAGHTVKASGGLHITSCATLRCELQGVRPYRVPLTCGSDDVGTGADECGVASKARTKRERPRQCLQHTGAAGANHSSSRLVGSL